MKAFVATIIAVSAVAAAVLSHPLDEETRETHAEDTAKSAVEVKTHPTVRCEHITPLNKKREEATADNHGACTGHCRSLEAGRKGGKCVDGMCHCEYNGRSRGDEGHPTVKCANLMPDHGKAHYQNHEGCRAHCESLNNGYRQGRCSEGVCNCYFRM